MKTIVFASLLFAALLHLPGTAQVYKWVDEKGNVHYSDRPQTLDTEQITIDVVPSVDSMAEADSDADKPQQAVAASTVANEPANAQSDTSAEPIPEPITPPAPAANCSAAAENARRILLSQGNRPEFRLAAAAADFKAGFVQACRQNSHTEAGKAEAVCIQRAKNFADFEACTR